MRIQDLTTDDLNKLWAKLAKSGRLDGKGGLSSRTIRSLNHLISQTLVDAQVQGLVGKNAAIGVTGKSQAGRCPPICSMMRDAH